MGEVDRREQDGTGVCRDKQARWIRQVDRCEQDGTGICTESQVCSKASEALRTIRCS